MKTNELTLIVAQYINKRKQTSLLFLHFLIFGLIYYQKSNLLKVSDTLKGNDYTFFDQQALQLDFKEH